MLSVFVTIATKRAKVLKIKRGMRKKVPHSHARAAATLRGACPHAAPDCPANMPGNYVLQHTDKRKSPFSSKIRPFCPMLGTFAPFEPSTVHPGAGTRGRCTRGQFQPDAWPFLARLRIATLEAVAVALIRGRTWSRGRSSLQVQKAGTRGQYLNIYNKAGALLALASGGAPFFVPLFGYFCAFCPIFLLLEIFLRFFFIFSSKNLRMYIICYTFASSKQNNRAGRLPATNKTRRTYSGTLQAFGPQKEKTYRAGRFSGYI